jgi:hypothetical protein
MRSWTSLVVGISYVSAAGSVIISIGWFLLIPPGVNWFEPAVQATGLVACLSGVLVERRAAARHRRRLALVALAEELAICDSIFDDPRFVPRASNPPRPQVYPRLPTSATEAVLISGVLYEHGDIELVRRLSAWRELAKGFNQRLDVTELRLFTVASRDEVEEFERALHRNDGYLNELRREVVELRAHPDLSEVPVPSRGVLGPAGVGAPHGHLLNLLPLRGRTERPGRVA